MAFAGRLRKAFKLTLVYAAIIAVTLFVFDLILIGLNLFPPTYDYGDPLVGWVAAHPTGEMREEGCVDLESGRVLRFTRNEDGMRTSHSATELRLPGEAVKIAVSGDSHTELCAVNDSTHFGVLERALDEAGMPASVFAYGAGKYSPLQAYLAVRGAARDYGADAIVLNLYTGNDFYDMLRVDDRPHMVPVGDRYELGEPVWYQHDAPGKQRRSRVLFAARRLAEKTGLRHVMLRVNYLSDVASSQGEGIGAVIGYTNDLRKATAPELGYPQAFTAQMLNQQLFFRRFPASRAESMRRVRALLEMIRNENPGTVLVMSPLPSYQLVNETPRDSVFLRALARAQLDYAEGVAEEQALFDELRQVAQDAGWHFIDNLTPLRAYTGEAPLYNGFDFHLLPVASEIIGRNQAHELARILAERPLSAGPPGAVTHAH